MNDNEDIKNCFLTQGKEMEKEDLTAKRSIYPRVSIITCPWTKVEYENISLEVLAKAAERGTEVHTHCTAYVRNDFLPSPNEEVNAYLESFKMFWQDLQNPKVELSETRLYDDELQFSGQADIIFSHEDKTVQLVDIKTTSSFNPAWGIQLSAYAHLAQVNGFSLSGALIVHVRRGTKLTKSEKVFYPSKPHFYYYSNNNLNDYWNQYFYPALQWYNLMKRRDTHEIPVTIPEKVKP